MQGHPQHDYEVGHVHADTLGHGHAQVDFYHNEQPMHITGRFWDDAFMVTPGQPAEYETVHHNAVYTTVYHDAVTHEETVVDGTVVDVTAQVREAVAQGHFKFQFNNAMNPGGIVSPDGTTVYVQIADPAFGFVKNVHIQFIGGFNPNVQTIDAQEYQVVNLGTN